MPNSVLDELGFNNQQDDNSAGGDPAVWTLLGEADKDPKGQYAVASTIANRAKQLKSTDYGQVVSDPNQGYEAWSNTDARAKTQKSYPVDSPEYQQAAQVLDDLKSGKQQPLPYTHFYSPEGQAALKRQPPGFEDNKTGVDIGGNRFFNVKNPNASVLNDLGFGEDSVQVDSDVTNAATKEPLPGIQGQAARALQEAGDLKIDPQKGALYKGMPFFVSQSGEEPQKPGDYWLDPKGQVHQVPVDYNGAVSFANGGLLGFGNKLMAGVQALKATGGNPTNPEFGNFYDQALSHYQGAQQAYTQEHPVEAGLTQTAGNLTTVVPGMALGGELLAPARAAMGPVGDFLAGASKGNKLLTAGSQAASGAIQGGAASGLTAQQSDTPFLQQVGEGAALGGIANPALNGVGSAVASKFNPQVPSAIRDLADKAVNKFNLDLRGSQIAGASDPAMALKDARLQNAAGSGFKKSNQDLLNQGTREVGKTFGVDSDSLTPKILEGAKRTIGNTMNDIAGRNYITQTDTLLTNLGNIVKDAKLTLPENEVSPLERQLENIGSTIGKDGVLSGESYKSLIKTGSPLDRAMSSSNSNIKHYAQQIRNSLDDALQNEAQGGDAEAFKNARLQYKNLMTVKDLPDINGKVPLADLDSAVSKQFKNRAFTGAGDLGDLADIGQTFMSNNAPYKQSIWKKYVNIPNLILGSEAGVIPATHDPVLAAKVAGGAGAAALAKYAGNVTSGAFNNQFLRNRILNPGRSTPVVSSVLNNFNIPGATLGLKNAFQQQPQGNR